MLRSSVRRAGRGATPHVALVGGLTLGGVLTGTVLWSTSGLLHGVPGVARATILLVVAVIVLLRDTGTFDIRLPQARRQIASDIFDRGRTRGLALFGLQLGTGVVTYLSAGAPYVLATGLLVSITPYGGFVAAGVGFGLGRFATSLSQAVGDLDQWDARWVARAPWLVPLLALAELVGWLSLVASGIS